MGWRAARPREQAAGSVVVGVTALALVATVMVWAVARTGAAAVERARAQSAADAAALAGALGGQSAARSAAARNGAVLERFAVDGTGQVTVTVTAARATATASAALGPARLLGARPGP